MGEIIAHAASLFARHRLETRFASRAMKDGTRFDVVSTLLGGKELSVFEIADGEAQISLGETYYPYELVDYRGERRALQEPLLSRLERLVRAELADS